MKKKTSDEPVCVYDATWDCLMMNCDRIAKGARLVNRLYKALMVFTVISFILIGILYVNGVLS